MSRNLIITLCIAGAMIITLLTTCGYTRIKVGHVGILVDLYGTNKGVQSTTMVTGGNFYNKWTQDIIEFPTIVQHKVWTKDSLEDKATNEEISVTTKDGMTVMFDVGLDYQVIPDSVPKIYMKWMLPLEDITNQYLRTAVRNSYNDAAGLFDADTLLFKRGKYETMARKLLNERIGNYFIVQQIGIIGKVRVPKNLEDAINDKIKATQEAQKVENEKRQVVAEAQKNIAKAVGDSTALVISAHAQAASIKINADAQAYANHELSQSLSSSVIQNNWILQWDGKLPTYQGSGVPLISIPK